MTNLAIVKDNIAAAATLIASNETITVDNLKVSGKGQIFRSTTNSVTITATFPLAEISCVSLVVCNLTETSTIRVRCYNAGNSIIYDSTAVQRVYYSMTDKVNHDGVLDARLFSLGGGSYASLFFDPVSCVKTVIDIVDSANTVGYIDIAYLIIGKTWTPKIGADYGASLLFSDSSKQSRTDLGDMKVNRMTRHRSLNFSLSTMDASDRQNLLEILIFNGLSTPLFIALFPDSSNAQEAQIYQMYGYITKLSGVTRIFALIDKNSVRVEEL